MQRIILLLLIALTFSSCFKEDSSGCPADMRLTFHLVDKFAPSDDYDSRITNDALFCVFKENKLVYKQLIPYQDIAKGKEYILRKTEEISGNMKFVSWAVPKGSPREGILSNISLGDSYENIKFNLTPETRSTEYYMPVTQDYYINSISINEAIDEPSVHNIDLVNGYCRVEVNIIDNSGLLNSTPYNIVVNGTMSSMDLNMNGIGVDASVDVPLTCPSQDGVKFTTGRFGVFPSASGDIVSVDIIRSVGLRTDKPLKTLTVPQGLIPMGAKVGDLLIFDYVIDDAAFYITINGFKQKIVITDM